MSIEKSTQKGEHISNSFEERLKRAESLVLDYLYRFALEEELVEKLKSEVDSICDDISKDCKSLSESHNESDDECLKEVNEEKKVFQKVVIDPLYATISEPVRLGAFRVLLNEVYRYVYNSPLKPYEDLAVHGLLREQQILPYSRGVHVGIDYIILLEYPHPNSDAKVVVPLFIVAKSRIEDVKKVKIKEAVNKVMEYVEEEDLEDRMLLAALDKFHLFTRVVIMRAKMSNELESCRLKYGDLVVYPNIACGVLGIALSDIPEIYNDIISDKYLSALTFGDWLYTLLTIISPAMLLAIEVGKSDEPPRGGGGQILKDLPSRINAVLNRAKASSKYVKELSKLLSNNFINRLEYITRKYTDRKETNKEGRRLALPA